LSRKVKKAGNVVQRKGIRGWGLDVWEHTAVTKTEQRHPRKREPIIITGE